MARAKQYCGWGFQILPFMEQENVWKGNPQYPKTMNYDVQRAIDAVGAVIPSYYCPARRNPTQLGPGGDWYVTWWYLQPGWNGTIGSGAYATATPWPPGVGLGMSIPHGTTDYAASTSGDGSGVVRQHNGNPNFSGVTIPQIRDGTSGTIMIADKRLGLAGLNQFQSDDNEGYSAGWDWDVERSGGWTWGSPAWGGTQSQWGNSVASGLPPGPDTNDWGNYNEWGSSHSEGLNVCFADGHVQFVTFRIDTNVWYFLTNIADGVPQNGPQWNY
jgi:prepilin-type processing-associated H-X9-DG protein